MNISFQRNDEGSVFFTVGTSDVKYEISTITAKVNQHGQRILSSNNTEINGVVVNDLIKGLNDTLDKDNELLSSTLYNFDALR